MPVLRRQIELANSNQESFKDNEEIFYCESTKEIFRNYEDYFKRIMLINSMVWTCELTGRTDLTYNEALQSEKSSKKMIKSFPLKIPTLLLANQLKCTSWKDMIDEITNYLKQRFCIGETVALVLNKKTKKNPLYKVVEVFNDKPNEDDPDGYRYKLEMDQVSAVKRLSQPLVLTVDGSDLYRPVTAVANYNRDRLKMFLRQFIFQKDNLLHVKEDLFKKYVDDDPNLVWKKQFPSKLPIFESSKRYEIIKDRLNTKKTKDKKVNGVPQNNKKNAQNGKQTSISKYLTKTSNDNKQTGGKETNKNKEINGPSTLEKMRIREEERKQKIEQEKERQKNIVSMVTKTVRELNQVNREDLQLRDMRPMPEFKPVTTLLPMEYFGDFVVILEFMHSFSDLLTMKDKFQGGIKMDILERALLLREPTGPLNDILQVLLSSIFWLQLEEEEYCDIQYVVPDKNIKSLQVSDSEKLTYYAARAAKYSNKYFGSKLTELPMDTFTINELIRMHLLASGANVSATTARWRFLNRGGYQSIDDPGFEFCVKYPHIVKFLEKSSIFELPFDDQLKLILCLINQIQTYSTVRTEIEQRLEQSTSAKINLKNFYVKQRRVKAEIGTQKIELQEEHKKKLDELSAQNLVPANLENMRQDLESKLEKSIQKIEKPLKELDKEFDQYRRDLFAFQMLLGSDRAYRNYWLFESLPGIFIEHCTPIGKCLASKPEQFPGLAECAIDQRYKFIKNYITKKFFNDKELNKENINDSSVKSNLELSADANLGTSVSNILFMCTTDATDCPVHTVNHPTYKQWSYIHTEEQIDDLIKSLNPLGVREGPLKTCLELQKPLILDHITNCPVDKLSVDLSQKDAILDKMIKNMKRYSPNSAIEDPTLILECATRENIYDLFDKVTSGHLGQTKVKDLKKWCENMMIGNYDELDFKMLDFEKIATRDYEDLGVHINDLIESQDDETMKQYNNNNDNNEIVKKLALLLLQIQQGIDKKFMKPPFSAVAKDPTPSERLTLNWQAAVYQCRNYSQILLLCNVLYDAIKWSKSIERAYCRTCRRRNEPEKMLLCDDCNAGYHMHCLKPKLKTIPLGDWFCVKCKPQSEKKQKKTAIFSDDTEEDDVDFECLNKSITDDNDVTFHVEDESVSSDDSEVDDNKEEASSEKQQPEEDDKAEEEEDEEEEKDKQCTLCNINYDDDDEFKLVECDKCPLVCHIECAIPPLKHKPRHWICWRCNKKLDKKKNKKADKKGKKKVKKEKAKEANTTTNGGGEVAQKRKGRPRKTSFPMDDDTESPEKPKKISKRKAINDDSELEENSPSSKRTRRSIDGEQLQNGHHHNGNANRRSRQNDLPLHIVVLHALLDDISKHIDSWPFNRPVSKVDVPDYYEIIKNPMDFAKIKSRLNVGHYASDYDIMNDIQQVFINCDMYNNSTSDIYKAGIRLEKFVQEKCKELNLPFRPSDMIIDDFEEDDDIPLGKRLQKKSGEATKIGGSSSSSSNKIMNGGD